MGLSANVLTLTPDRIVELLKLFSHEDNRLSRLHDKLNSKDVVITEEVASGGPLINVYGIRVKMWREKGNQYYVVIERMLENLRALSEDTLLSIRVSKDQQDPGPVFILKDNARSKILGILGDGA